MRLRVSKTGASAATGILLGGLSLLLWAAFGLTKVEAQTQPPNPKVMQQVRKQVSGTSAAQKPAPPKLAVAAAEKPATPGVVKRRDPFRSLLVRLDEMAGGQPLPPGKRGLVIAQLNVNGVVATPTGMIAVVTMSGRNRAYFLRERDELYNGTVGEISEDGVVFKETTVDAFGKEYQRDVVKQITTGATKKSGAGVRR